MKRILLLLFTLSLITLMGCGNEYWIGNESALQITNQFNVAIQQGDTNTLNEILDDNFSIWSPTSYSSQNTITNEYSVPYEFRWFSEINTLNKEQFINFIENNSFPSDIEKSRLHTWGEPDEFTGEQGNILYKITGSTGSRIEMSCGLSFVDRGFLVFEDCKISKFMVVQIRVLSD